MGYIHKYPIPPIEYIDKPHKEILIILMMVNLENIPEEDSDIPEELKQKIKQDHPDEFISDLMIEELKLVNGDLSNGNCCYDESSGKITYKNSNTKIRVYIGLQVRWMHKFQQTVERWVEKGNAKYFSDIWEQTHQE